jgi:hypothetical protein
MRSLSHNKYFYFQFFTTALNTTRNNWSLHKGVFAWLLVRPLSSYGKAVLKKNCAQEGHKKFPTIKVNHIQKYRMSGDNVNTSGSRTWCHSLSEISYEHRSSCQWLWSYRYLKFKIHVSYSIKKFVYSAFIHIFHGYLEKWGSVTAVANSANHHDQSTGQETAHSGTPSHADWNVECPVKLEVHL